jgi:hypothetical protein
LQKAVIIDTQRKEILLNYINYCINTAENCKKAFEIYDHNTNDFLGIPSYKNPFIPFKGNVTCNTDSTIPGCTQAAFAAAAIILAILIFLFCKLALASDNESSDTPRKDRTIAIHSSRF